MKFPLTVATGLIVFAVAAAPAVQADSSDFLDRIQALGWYDDRGDAHLLDNGYEVCRMLSRGYNGTQVAQEIYSSTDLSVTASDAIEFVIIAVEELCPQYDNRGQSVT